MKRLVPLSLILVTGLVTAGFSWLRFEQHNGVAPLRPLTQHYNSSFFYRHNEAYRASAAIHFAHAKQHDILQLTPLSRSEHFDRSFDAEMVKWLYDPPRTEPHMMYFGPHTGQAMWKLYRAIDWTHVHHEETYDILSSKDIPWSEKKKWTDNAVEYYLHKNSSVARSPAPLEVTMRRAGIMMKPYVGYFRNNYPQSNNFFYVAHWWHPAIYEAMMIAGNDEEQHQAVQETHKLTFDRALEKRPLRMLLSREMMPRYSRMSPESANIFDNLHMLHGIAYDILAYEGWSLEEKRKELYRVIEAMSYHPGDEKLARKFDIPHPDMDPRVYVDWMTAYEGSMNKIMREMMQEMWPSMSPDGSAEIPGNVMEQMRMKLTPGIQEREEPGSLHDAIMALVPDMKMDKKSMKPGITPEKMVKAMMQGWQKKYGDRAGVEPISMENDPRLRPVREEGGAA